MKKLLIENFKAFHHALNLQSPNEENILIYGENGSGKSSLYDAFQLYYFREKVFNERIAPNVVAENRAAEEASVIDSFRNDKTNDAIVLEIDEKKYDEHHSLPDEQVFMFSYMNLHHRNDAEDNINIRRMLEQSLFKYEDSIANWFDEDAEKEIIANTNKTLQETFYLEELALSHSQTGDGICMLERKNRVDKKKEHLSRYFNEASLHLVRFIVLMECISFERNRQKPALLVLDDCLNSLDAANRTFMMRYLFMKTKGMQKVIMTHNLSYYNLMCHILSTEHEDENWLKYIFCFVDGCYELRPEDKIACVDDIIAKKNAGQYANSAQLGNAIRQAFEVLVYRLSMLCNIGTMQESKYLLDLLCKQSDNVFLSVDCHGNAKTATALVDEIYRNVTNGNDFNLSQRLKDKIDKFRANDILAPLIPVLKELRLLQKVALHQASHGHAGLPPVQSKEFDVSLALLKKIESAILSIKGQDLSTL